MENNKNDNLENNSNNSSSNIDNSGSGDNKSSGNGDNLNSSSDNTNNYKHSNKNDNNEDTSTINNNDNSNNNNLNNSNDNNTNIGNENNSNNNIKNDNINNNNNNNNNNKTLSNKKKKKFKKKKDVDYKDLLLKIPHNPVSNFNSLENEIDTPSSDTANNLTNNNKDFEINMDDLKIPENNKPSNNNLIINKNIIDNNSENKNISNSSKRSKNNLDDNDVSIEMNDLNNSGGDKKKYHKKSSSLDEYSRKRKNKIGFLSFFQKGDQKNSPILTSSENVPSALIPSATDSYPIHHFGHHKRFSSSSSEGSDISKSRSYASSLEKRPLSVNDSYSNSPIKDTSTNYSPQYNNITPSSASDLQQQNNKINNKINNQHQPQQYQQHQQHQQHQHQHQHQHQNQHQQKKQHQHQHQHQNPVNIDTTTSKHSNIDKNSSSGQISPKFETISATGISTKNGYNPKSADIEHYPITDKRNNYQPPLTPSSYQSTGFPFTQSPKVDGKRNVFKKFKKKLATTLNYNQSMIGFPPTNSAFNHPSWNNTIRHNSLGGNSTSGLNINNSLNNSPYNGYNSRSISHDEWLRQLYHKHLEKYEKTKFVKYTILKPWSLISWIIRPGRIANYQSKILYRRAYILNFLNIVLFIVYLLSTILSSYEWFVFAPGILLSVIYYFFGKVNNRMYVIAFFTIATATAINITSVIYDLTHNRNTTRLIFSWDLLVMIMVPLLFPSIVYSIVMLIIVSVAYIGMGAYVESSNNFYLLDAYNNFGELIRSIIIVFVILTFYTILSSVDLKEIERKELRIQSLFRISNEALVVHKDGLITDANPAFESMFQIKLQDLLYPIQSGIWEFLPALEGMFEPGASKTFDNSDIGVIETTGIDSSGRTFQVEVRTNKATYGGEPVDVISIIDITGRKQLMEADYALRKAEAANEAKVIFLTTVSHELRTPINGVLASADILERTTLDSTQKEFLNCIKLSGNYLLDLINDILDYSKIEAGKMEIIKYDFSILKMLDNGIRIVSKNIYEKGLDLCVFIDPNVPVIINGDGRRIKQILLNFLSNSIKFTNEGQIIIRVKLENEKDNESLIKIDVEDSGIGIKPEHLGQLFASFSQIDSGNSRKYQGTGLGLSISKRLCKMMGGDVHVKSEFGVGSTFSFTIPCGYSTTIPKFTLQQLGSSIYMGEDIQGINKPIGKKKYGASGVVGIVIDGNQYIRKSISQFFAILKITCVDFENKKEFENYLSTLVVADVHPSNPQVYLVITSFIEINQNTTNHLPTDRIYHWILMESPNEERKLPPEFENRIVKPCQFADIVRCLYKIDSVNFFVDTMAGSPSRSFSSSSANSDGELSSSEHLLMSTPISDIDNYEELGLFNQNLVSFSQNQNYNHRRQHHHSLPIESLEISPSFFTRKPHRSQPVTPITTGMTPMMESDKSPTSNSSGGHFSRTSSFSNNTSNTASPNSSKITQSFIFSPATRRFSLNEIMSPPLPNNNVFPHVSNSPSMEGGSFPINMETVYKKIESHNQNFKRGERHTISPSQSNQSSPVMYQQPLDSNLTRSPTTMKLPLPPSYYGNGNVCSLKPLKEDEVLSSISENSPPLPLIPPTTPTISRFSTLSTKSSDSTTLKTSKPINLSSSSPIPPPPSNFSHLSNTLSTPSTPTHKKPNILSSSTSSTPNIEGISIKKPKTTTTTTTTQQHPPQTTTTTTTTTTSSNKSDETSSKSNTSGTASTTTTTTTKNKEEKILLVEDNFVNVKIFSKLLKDSGYKFTVANNGIEAVEKVKEGEYDLILMDCQMPEMDGFEATTIIRNLEKSNSIKPPPSKKQSHIIIIALTANSGYKDKQKCLSVGMDDFLQKPIKTADTLIQMIKKHLN